MANLECRNLREERMRASEMAKATHENAAISGPRIARFGLKDLRVTQEEQAKDLSRQGYVFHAECKSDDEFANGCKRRRWPVGARHLWAIGQVWAPGVVVQQPAPEEQADAA